MKKENWIKAKSVDDYDESSNVYFTKETQEKIIEYIEGKHPIFKRNMIYEKYIDHVFEEMVRIQINDFNFNDTGEDFESLVAETKVKLFNVLEDSRLSVDEEKGYDSKKGSAFSYFSRACKNYLIQKQKKYQELRNKNIISSIEDDVTYYIDNLAYEDEPELDYNELLQMTYNWFMKNYQDMFEKSEDKKICLAIISVLKNDAVDLEDKKTLMFMVKEQTNEDNYRVNKVLKEMKSIFNKIEQEYIKNSYVNANTKFHGQE